MVIYNPSYRNIYHLKYPIFVGLGTMQIVLSALLSVFFLQRWYATGKTNTPLRIFGISYLFIIGIGTAHILHGLGIIDRSNPRTFISFFQAFIWWTSGMLYGILNFYTDNRKLQIIPPFIVFVLAYVWSLITFVELNNIKLGMNGLIYFFLAPTLALITYAFYLYSKTHKSHFAKLIVLGYTIHLIAFLNWAPTVFTDLWYLVSYVFVCTLAITLLGFIGLICEAW